jgi:hypothetical protein
VATAAPLPPDRPQQLWLDVARPIQPRPPRERSVPARRQGEPTAGPQMELRMAAPSPAPITPPRAARPDAVAKATRPAIRYAAMTMERPCFVTWLLGQSKSGGTIGELAKAARADPFFPRKGSAEAVRAHFGRAGADGDAYAALEDAERAYDRCG